MLPAEANDHPTTPLPLIARPLDVDERPARGGYWLDPHPAGGARVILNVPDHGAIVFHLTEDEQVLLSTFTDAELGRWSDQ